MLRPKHHLYLYVVSAQKSHGLFSDYFPTAYAFQALILLGHSDIGVTLNVYTHLGLIDAKEEMNRIAKLA